MTDFSVFELYLSFLEGWRSKVYLDHDSRVRLILEEIELFEACGHLDAQTAIVWVVRRGLLTRRVVAEKQKLIVLPCDQVNVVRIRNGESSLEILLNIINVIVILR